MIGNYHVEVLLELDLLFLDELVEILCDVQNFYVHSALSIEGLESVIAVGAGGDDGLNALGLESLDVGVGSFAELIEESHLICPACAAHIEVAHVTELYAGSDEGLCSLLCVGLEVLVIAVLASGEEYYFCILGPLDALCPCLSLCLLLAGNEGLLILEGVDHSLLLRSGESLEDRFVLELYAVVEAFQVEPGDLAGNVAGAAGCAGLNCVEPFRAALEVVVAGQISLTYLPLTAQRVHVPLIVEIGGAVLAEALGLDLIERYPLATEAVGATLHHR